MDDLIEGIKNISLEDNGAPSQSFEKPSHKIPKWVMNTLESLHHNEIGKTRMRNSTRQYDGCILDNSNSSDPNSSNNMEASFDCEFNLSTNCEPNSFGEVACHEEWKESMQKECDSLIKNGTWKLVDPPYVTKPIGWKWIYKNKYKYDVSLDNHKERIV